MRLIRKEKTSAQQPTNDKEKEGLMYDVMGQHGPCRLPVLSLIQCLHHDLNQSQRALNEHRAVSPFSWEPMRSRVAEGLERERGRESLSRNQPRATLIRSINLTRSPTLMRASTPGVKNLSLSIPSAMNHNVHHCPPSRLDSPTFDDGGIGIISVPVVATASSRMDFDINCSYELGMTRPFSRSQTLTPISSDVVPHPVQIMLADFFAVSPSPERDFMD